MTKIALTYRNERNIVCTEVVDTEAPRYLELTESIFTSNQTFLSSKKVSDDAKVGVTSRKRILRYSDQRSHKYREKDITYRMEKLEDGTEIPRFVNFKPFNVLGITVHNAPTQDGDLLMINISSDGNYIPRDPDKVKALRYVLRLLQSFNNALMNEDGEDDNDSSEANGNNDQADKLKLETKTNMDQYSNDEKATNNAKNEHGYNHYR
ncbi:hypothetical protein LMB49_03820 [Limosilactobacillus reuteri]|uniref:hypothetical protein n=1 Tax=Limosilactobacillus reuteri TaxID=1598 RepID=UPI001E561207|nr:hypothetical protein [Limosilactobacillus reuteri]MCC4370525.1 hypothetical protein [Limosilactobacillus reuteri]MCC4509420.1 hypothetical protein [Limosilactobacillus reuteri]